MLGQEQERRIQSISVSFALLPPLWIHSLGLWWCLTGLALLLIPAADKGDRVSSGRRGSEGWVSPQTCQRGKITRIGGSRQRRITQRKKNIEMWRENQTMIRTVTSAVHIFLRRSCGFWQRAVWHLRCWTSDSYLGLSWQQQIYLPLQNKDTTQSTTALSLRKRRANVLLWPFTFNDFGNSLWFQVDQIGTAAVDGGDLGEVGA